MVLPPGVLFAATTAERSVTMPGPGWRISAKLLTLKTAGARRSSRPSKRSRALCRSLAEVLRHDRKDWGRVCRESNQLRKDIANSLNERGTGIVTKQGSGVRGQEAQNGSGSHSPVLIPDS